MIARHSEVLEVIWFGSWVTGQPSRRSDVDLCLLLSDSPIPRIRDRIPQYLPDRFPGGMDLFPYTQVEFDRLRTSRASWWRAIRAGRTVVRRPAAP
ncbi:MAG: nucleotidyltransferase domain-containing protein [Nitrospirales bacterium]